MRRLLAAFAVLAAGASCGRAAPAPGAGVPASLQQLQDEPTELVGVVAEPVVGFTGPGGEPFEVALRAADAQSHLERRIGARSFALQLRTDGASRTQYPCSSCHQGAVTLRRDRDVHQNIQPSHPPGIAVTCFACHRSSAVDRLALNSGETATFDHAYRLCAQCHFQEVSAWAEGHHGKRLDGWQGRRVVMGCAECHDPHRPVVATRVPFPGPTLPDDGALQPGEAGSPERPGGRFPLSPTFGRAP